MGANWNMSTNSSKSSNLFQIGIALDEVVRNNQSFETLANRKRLTLTWYYCKAPGSHVSFKNVEF
jgi:hypothetical protein